MSVDLSLWCAAEGVVAFFVIFGNVLSIIVFVTNPRLRCMRTSILLINLSVADLIVGAVTIPMYMSVIWPGSNFTLHKNFHYYLSFIAIDLLSGFGSVVGLTIIAIERLYSVQFPQRHRNTTRAVYYGLVAATWVLAGLQMLLRILHGYSYISFTAFFYCMVVSLTVCLCIICSSYSAVWVRVHFKRPAQRTQTRDHTREMKLAATLAIITVLFVLTWMPFHILNIICFFTKSCEGVPPAIVYSFKLLHYSNSLINPVVYSSRFPEYRRTIRKVLCCRSLGTISPGQSMANLDGSHINTQGSPFASPLVIRRNAANTQGVSPTIQINNVT
ncbi:adenosine receptor A2a [Nematostella vectensis]|uniref:adenosine receptor A2a n=1 Tax=Nematostella vectensis TaxID=45351 RepID=UPI0013903D14|nr:adenosine receptor A2a [Nematostella vectensis]XP_032242231.1 adenosine receptor A2a [Nematostella vectensis]XP_032242232.1 adenosine receptor A2a [Nematostella vectensis]XP_032242233.1 adenosine receptor A2a [Nematostella vectensis]XP_032242234.1 adenosine receptor A2a [Nematostella vectensis]XP_048589150.1 adenosine receptor A2a [Nematostella vectensis]XP_048589151.1 adenosine receptor A2a [Nematostella vectensis]